jgi:hypothetical protein
MSWNFIFGACKVEKMEIRPVVVVVVVDLMVLGPGLCLGVESLGLSPGGDYDGMLNSKSRHN